MEEILMDPEHCPILQLRMSCFVSLIYGQRNIAFCTEILSLCEFRAAATYHPAAIIEWPFHRLSFRGSLSRLRRSSQTIDDHGDSGGDGSAIHSLLPRGPECL